MPFSETPLPGIIIFEPAVYPDERGFFFESYNKKLFQSHHITDEFVQDNQSYSVYGVIRGLHYQREPYAQSKLVGLSKVKFWMLLWTYVSDRRDLVKRTAYCFRQKTENKSMCPRGLLMAFLY